jgi:hypothetical protein
MLTKALLFTILGACGVAAGAASNPDDLAPPREPPQERETHWCCDSINAQQASGEGCEEIIITAVAGCAKVLHCTGKYTYDDGKVTCH